MWACVYTCEHVKMSVSMCGHTVYVDVYMTCVGVVDVFRLSDIRSSGGVVQWNISSSLPGECYGSYSLLITRCMIESFTILPTLTLSDDAVNGIISGECACCV